MHLSGGRPGFLSLQHQLWIPLLCMQIHIVCITHFKFKFAMSILLWSLQYRYIVVLLSAFTVGFNAISISHSLIILCQVKWMQCCSLLINVCIIKWKIDSYASTCWKCVCMHMHIHIATVRVYGINPNMLPSWHRCRDPLCTWLQRVCEVWAILSNWLDGFIQLTVYPITWDSLCGNIRRDLFATVSLYTS